MMTENPFEKIETRRLLALLVVVELFCPLIFSLPTKVWNVSLDQQLQSNLIYILQCLLVLVWIGILAKEKVLNLRLFHTPDRKLSVIRLSWLALALGIFRLGVITASYGLLAYLFPSLIEYLHDAADSLPSRDSQSILDVSLEIFIIVLLAPVFEELLFRGVLLNRWSTKWGIRTGIITTSIVFGLIHGEFLGPFIFGIFMSLLYIQTKSLLAPIIVHGLNNAVAAVGVLVSRLIQSKPDLPSAASMGEALGFAIFLGIFLAVIAAPYPLIYLYRNWPPSLAEIPYSPRHDSCDPDPPEEACATQTDSEPSPTLEADSGTTPNPDHDPVG